MQPQEGLVCHDPREDLHELRDWHKIDKGCGQWGAKCMSAIHDSQKLANLSTPGRGASRNSCTWASAFLILVSHLAAGDWTVYHQDFQIVCWDSPELHIHDKFAVESAELKIKLLDESFEKEALCADNAHLTIIFASGAGLSCLSTGTPEELAHPVHLHFQDRLDQDVSNGRPHV